MNHRTLDAGPKLCAPHSAYAGLPHPLPPATLAGEGVSEFKTPTPILPLSQGGASGRTFILGGQTRRLLLPVSCLLLLVASLLLPGQGWAQNTVSGYVKDAETGETLIGATVLAPTYETGAYTNQYGFFSLTVPGDTATVVINYLGYLPIRQFVDFKVAGAGSNLTFKLQPEGSTADEVLIESEDLTAKVNQVQMSSTKLDIKTMQNIPAIFGEVDIIKVLQFLPGIQSGTEGTAGFFVRGGSADQNLILLDDAVIYNASHLGGLFSVFNPDAVKSMEVFKGNFPARYGGRLSSVLDITMKEGNNQNYNVSGGLGLISSRLTVEGPIQKDKSSFLLSGRRTYLDLFTGIINEANKNTPDYQPLPGYYFWDVNLKGNVDLGPRDRLFVSGYYGKDVFNFTDQTLSFNLNWGNLMGAVRWNHLFTDKLFMNTSLVFTDYRYDINNKFAEFTASLFSKIQDWALKSSLDFFPSPKHQIKFGAEYTYHTFTPSGFSATSSADDDFKLGFTQSLYGSEASIYANHDWDATPRLKLNYGLRLSGFVGKGGATYGGLEPRVAARFKLNTNLALKASYARMYQYIHLVSSSTVTLPTDVWYPSTQRVRPQYSDQLVLGLSQVWPKQGLSLTVEGYYKWLSNQLEYRENAQIFANVNLDEEFVFGRGTSYGAEVLFEKTKGKFTGWVSYTLSWTDRTFADINGGQTFPFRYDRRHNASIVLNYSPTDRWTFTVAWTYRTGEAITLPSSRFLMNDLAGIRSTGLSFDPNGGVLFNPGLIVPVYQERNSFRMPDYHRLDLSVTYNFKPKKHFEHSLNFSVYNAYNRANPFFLYFDTVTNDQDIPTGFEAKVVALFPALPSFTWNFKFK